MWFGDHPANPARRLVDGRTLIEWEAEDATREPLAFLLKILAEIGRASCRERVLRLV